LVGRSHVHAEGLVAGARHFLHDTLGKTDAAWPVK
jgi:hypothetical protein